MQDIYRDIEKNAKRVVDFTIYGDMMFWEEFCEWCIDNDLATYKNHVVAAYAVTAATEGYSKEDLHTPTVIELILRIETYVRRIRNKEVPPEF